MLIAENLRCLETTVFIMKFIIDIYTHQIILYNKLSFQEGDIIQVKKVYDYFVKNIRH